MYIAQAKRKENIAEYILYLWQLEDLLRALRFSPEAIWSQLVAPQIPGDEERQNNLLMWYMDVGSLLREEGKEKTGHLDHTLHLIGDLNNLHEQLLQAPAGEHYRELYARAASAAAHRTAGDIRYGTRFPDALRRHALPHEGGQDKRELNLRCD